MGQKVTRDEGEAAGGGWGCGGGSGAMWRSKITGSYINIIIILNIT